MPPPTVESSTFPHHRGTISPAKYYGKNDTEIGNDPFKPAGAVLAFKSPDSAFKRVRSGLPDWVLFKRGDLWSGTVTPKNGRSADEPSLIAGYGADGDMPLFTSVSGIRICCKSFRYIALSGLAFYASQRDRPTNRTLGWYMEMNDWDGGIVAGNLLLHDTSAVVNNIYGMKLIGQSRNVTITGNIIHGLSANQPLVIFEETSDKQSIVFTDNELQVPDLTVRLVSIDAV